MGTNQPRPGAMLTGHVGSLRVPLPLNPDAQEDPEGSRAHSEQEASSVPAPSPGAFQQKPRPVRWREELGPTVCPPVCRPALRRGRLSGSQRRLWPGCIMRQACLGAGRQPRAPHL